jgi:Fe-S-cluster containining protein
LDKESENQNKLLEMQQQFNKQMRAFDANMPKAEKIRLRAFLHKMKEADSKMTPDQKKFCTYIVAMQSTLFERDVDPKQWEMGNKLAKWFSTEYCMTCKTHSSCCYVPSNPPQPCFFLVIDPIRGWRKCSVYGIRPMQCRLYFCKTECKLSTLRKKMKELGFKGKVLNMAKKSKEEVKENVPSGPVQQG